MKIIENKDKDLVAHIRKVIYEKNGHCCCSIFPTDDNKCMCKEFRDQIKSKKLGSCHCGLYEIIE